MMKSLCLPLRQSDIDAVIARIRAGELPLIGISAQVPDLPPSIHIVVGGSLSSKRAALLAKACSDHGCEVIDPAKKVQPNLPPGTIIIADEESHASAASAAAKVYTACRCDPNLNWVRAGGVRDLVDRGSARSVARPLELAGASRHGQPLHHSVRLYAGARTHCCGSPASCKSSEEAQEVAAHPPTLSVTAVLNQ